jgi:hypothetical protein
MKELVFFIIGVCAGGSFMHGFLSAEPEANVCPTISHNMCEVAHTAINEKFPCDVVTFMQKPPARNITAACDNGGFFYTVVIDENGARAYRN